MHSFTTFRQSEQGLVCHWDSLSTSLAMSPGRNLSSAFKFPCSPNLYPVTVSYSDPKCNHSASRVRTSSFVLHLEWLPVYSTERGHNLGPLALPLPVYEPPDLQPITLSRLCYQPLDNRPSSDVNQAAVNAGADVRHVHVRCSHGMFYIFGNRHA